MISHLLPRLVKKDSFKSFFFIIFFLQSIHNQNIKGNGFLQLRKTSVFIWFLYGEMKWLKYNLALKLTIETNH
jgi:hypothetical protein